MGQDSTLAKGRPDKGPESSCAPVSRFCRCRGVRKIGTLTPREAEILGLIALGMSDREMVHHLAISEGTVRAHISSVFRKLGAASRLQAATVALAAKPSTCQFR